MTKNSTGKMTVLGLMSGTSLDGLDLALCQFELTENGYGFKILQSRTCDYNADWKNKLRNIKDASAEKYFELHGLYGKYMANEVLKFLSNSKTTPQAIASHGHTIFHQPKSGFSTQIGCGATIAATTGITTICDFRSLDVANGGQGAPLVPVGDKLLFAGYDACLNIGGVANISFDDAYQKRLAYDICEANMLLNYLAEKTGKAFDENGNLARKGKINKALLDKLNAPEYYRQNGARSIGREWFEKNILSVIELADLDVTDMLATSIEHIAEIIAAELSSQQVKNVLITGGGAFNTFLIEKIKSKTSCEIIIPETTIINFKEALIFAFLGYLRINKKINALSSVTGASNDSIGGAVYQGR